MNNAIEFRSMAFNLSAIEIHTRIQYLEVGPVTLKEDNYEQCAPDEATLWVVYMRLFYGDILVAKALADSTTEEGANELKTLLERVVTCYSGPIPDPNFLA